MSRGFINPLAFSFNRTNSKQSSTMFRQLTLLLAIALFAHGKWANSLWHNSPTCDYDSIGEIASVQEGCELVSSPPYDTAYWSTTCTSEGVLRRRCNDSACTQCEDGDLSLFNSCNPTLGPAWSSVQCTEDK